MKDVGALYQVLEGLAAFRSEIDAAVREADAPNQGYVVKMYREYRDVTRSVHVLTAVVNDVVACDGPVDNIVEPLRALRRELAAFQTTLWDAGTEIDGYWYARALERFEEVIRQIDEYLRAA